MLAWAWVALLAHAFDARCGRTHRLGGCAGFSDCVLRVMNSSEAGFLRRRRAVLGLPAAQLPNVPRCTRQSCLDLARCIPPFRFFVYDRDSLAAAGLGDNVTTCMQTADAWEPSSARLITRDPARACLFWIKVSATRGCKSYNRVGQLLRRLPHWNGGLNHIVFESTDKGIPRTLRSKYLGKAGLAQGFSTVDNFVHGLDVAIPLRSTPNAPKLNALLGGAAPWRRKWLLTFKGTATNALRSRMALYHDELSRVVIAVYPNPHKCTRKGRAMPIDGRQIQLVALDFGANEACCAQIEHLYSSYNFYDLMNTTFGLVMPGRSPASYRLAEVLAAGCVPVFVGMEYGLLPFAELIPWSEFSISAPGDVDVQAGLLPKLRALANDRPRLLRMQAHALGVYTEHFLPVAYGGRTSDANVRRTTLELLRRRFEYEQPFRQ
ncbi:exostosin family-domain-containing protein [Pavlovales sp. CCMP2436]|nr:exostosin family-domain-containing protein [Pavlovales sp. CCMP2436]|mmetsp:Transcript_16949/g.43361  ORF Transcript_16949/g.43361 Transcript_16949/m.43361 type:complete len:435 (-) Transcript_16949:109-1413(-)|eukprot:CAMPEP_0180037500 /NCGR_PEP_ID=MMETSP0984-20121128/31613_1 /TAXON_ID=483367 /ORGANISM="non described non described, Strain CCMP 2436" /LENGTH=434 /DNA_ID=CAMNT_0021963985 /DNA_START=1 /DNA_END=1305 /DNA_ORIENTATION=+